MTFSPMLALVFAVSLLTTPFTSIPAAVCVGGLSLLLVPAFAKWKKLSIFGVPALLFAGGLAARNLWLLLSRFLLPGSGIALWLPLSLVPVAVLITLGLEAISRTARLLLPLWGSAYAVLVVIVTAKNGDMTNFRLRFDEFAELQDAIPLLWTPLAARREEKSKAAVLSALCGVLAGLLGLCAETLLFGDYPVKTLLPVMRFSGQGVAFGHLNALAGLLLLPGLLLTVSAAICGAWESGKAFFNKRKAKTAVCAVLCLCLLSLSGCDGTEPGEQIFALNVALDAGESNALRLTLQYPQITPVGKTDEENGDSSLQKNGYQLVQTEGATPESCLDAMRLVTPRKVSLMQVRGVFFGESLVSDAALFEEVLTFLSQSGEFRPTALVFVTRGRAEDVLSSQVPQFGARLSKSHAAQKAVLAETGVVTETRLFDFLKTCAEGKTSPILTLAAVNNQQYIDNLPDSGRTGTDYLAGDVPRNAVTSIDYCGCAVLTEDKPLLLTGYETQLLNLISGDLREIYGARAAKKPRIRVDNGAIVCEIALYGKNTEQVLSDIGLLLGKLQESGVQPFTTD